MSKLDLVQTWLDSVALSHSGAKTTEALYRYEFEAFLKFIGLTAEDIQRDYDTLPEKDFRQKYARALRAWSSHLMRQDKYTQSSVASFIIAAKSFFKHNDFPLGFMATIRKRVVYHNRDLTKEEILQVLGVSAPREKAFYAMMAQSGLRPTSLCMLRLKNLEPDYSQKHIPLMIRVPEESTKGQYHEYFTFIGEDADRLLRDYLNTRRNLTPENFVFVNQGSDEPMIYNTISSMFRKAVRLLRDKGVIAYEQKKADRPAEIRLYSLRKWFRKMAIQAGFENVEFWMGHRGPGVDEAYRPKDPEFYRKIYAEKAMPFLRLESSAPLEVDKQIAELRGENAALREKLQKSAQSFEERLTFIEERVLKIGDLYRFGNKQPPPPPEEIEKRRRWREEQIKKAKEDAATENEPKRD